MKIGYSLWGMPKVPVTESIPALAKMGFQGLELAVTPGWNTALDNLDDAYRHLIKKLFAENGLALTAVAGHTSMIDRDPSKNQANMDYLRRAIDLAAELRQPGQPAIMASLVGGRPEDWLPWRELLAERIHALGDYAQSQDVILAIEPHCGTALDLPDKATWLFATVNHPSVRMNFDISHMDVMGIGIDECVPIMAPLAVHTHVKDQTGIYPNHTFLTPGEGPFDFKHYLRAMQAAGYDGYVVAEVSVMVQRRPDYDAITHAELCYRTLDNAFQAVGIDRNS
ncbi:MAG: sugar phosphate isomerase/epimerase family protein [Anaerolineae bacterium]